MKKLLLLGILGVLFLQLGLIAYTSTERAFEARPRVAPVDDVLISNVGTAALPEIAAPAAAVVAERKTVAVRTVRRTERIVPQLARAKRPVRDIEPRRDALRTEATPNEAKRSFFARIVPVLKKPYDWAKALGSKMK